MNKTTSFVLTHFSFLLISTAVFHTSVSSRVGCCQYHCMSTTTANYYFLSIAVIQILNALPLSLSSLPAFSWGLQVSSWRSSRHVLRTSIISIISLRVKSQAIPSKIRNVISPSSSRSSNSSFPFALTSKACLGSLPWGILPTWPNHLSWDLSIRKSNGSMFRNFRITPDLTFVLNNTFG